jgi:hypothetical protein
MPVSKNGNDDFHPANKLVRSWGDSAMRTAIKTTKAERDSSATIDIVRENTVQKVDKPE